MCGIGPGIDAEDAPRCDNAVEFFNAGGGVVGKVDVCACESVGDAGGGDILVRLVLALSLFERGE